MDGWKVAMEVKCVMLKCSGSDT